MNYLSFFLHKLTAIFPATCGAAALEALLARLRLEKFGAALGELGVESPADLSYLQAPMWVMRMVPLPGFTGLTGLPGFNWI